MPADVSISKSALYSRIGASDAEGTAGLLYPQPDLDSALRLARAEVRFLQSLEKEAHAPCGLLFASFLPSGSYYGHLLSRKVKECKQITLGGGEGNQRGF